MKYFEQGKLHRKFKEGMWEERNESTEKLSQRIFNVFWEYMYSDIQDKDLKGSKVKKPLLSFIFSNLIVMIVYSPSDCQLDRN